MTKKVVIIISKEVNFPDHFRIAIKGKHSLAYHKDELKELRKKLNELEL